MAHRPARARACRECNALLAGAAYLQLPSTVTGLKGQSCLCLSCTDKLIAKTKWGGELASVRGFVTRYLHEHTTVSVPALQKRVAELEKLLSTLTDPNNERD